MPDHGLVRACLESYRSLASTPERMLTDRRPAEPQPGAHGPPGDDRGGRPPAQDACLDRPARADPAGRRGDPRRPPRRRGEVGPSRHHQPGRRGARRGRLHLVRPRQGRLPVRGRVDRDARRAAPAQARPDPARRGAHPLPGDRPGTGGAGPLQARSLAAPAGRPRRRHVAHHQVEPPADLPGAAIRSTWPTSSRSSGSTRRSSARRSRWRCSVALRASPDRRR